MAYTTRQLIIEAYYLSGLVGRDYQFVDGDEVNDGLNRLNGFLQIKGAQSKLIQYYNVVESNFVAGQEIYFIPNLIEIDTLTFFLLNYNDQNTTSVRFQLQPLSRYEYFAIPRAEHVETLPYSYHLERCLGGSNLYIYFIPDQPYPFQLTGKYALSSTQLNQDLSLVYDGWYLEYLKYGLALYLCEWRNIAKPMGVVETFNKMEQHLTSLSPRDLSFRKLCYFKNSGGLNWGDVNYGKGWRNSS